MRLDDADLEGTASWAIVRAGLDLTEPVDPFALAYGLRAQVVRGAPRGCGGVTVANDPPTIAVRMRGTESEIAARLAHELAHIALARTGVASCHDERDVDEIARRILVPSGFVRVACLARGIGIRELPELCPLVCRGLVIARARYVLRLDVAIGESAAISALAAGDVFGTSRSLLQTGQRCRT